MFRKEPIWVPSVRWLCVFGLAVAGCTGDNVGVPQPEPVPRGSLLRATSAGRPGSVDLVGLPGAVDGVGNVTVETSRGTSAISTTAIGSFALSIPVAGEESISLRFDALPRVAFRLRAGNTPGPDPRIPIVESVGSTVNFAVTAPRDATVVVANFNRGIVVVERATDQGARVTIEAQPGDELRIYVDGAPLSDPVKFTVN